MGKNMVFQEQRHEESSLVQVEDACLQRVGRQVGTK
jgi:hypothetical protein